MSPRGQFGSDKNLFFQLYGQTGGLGIFPHLQALGLEGSFIRLDSTSDDTSFAVNGIHIIRVHNNKISTLPLELARLEVIERLLYASNNYSDAKVAELLKYSPDVDYRLPEISTLEKIQRKFNPYYFYYQIMKMPSEDFKLRVGDLLSDATPDMVLAKKKEFVEKVCRENGVPSSELPIGYGVKRLRNEIEIISAPIVQRLKEKISGDILKLMIDNIAQRYSPDKIQFVQDVVKRIASIFSDLYSRSKYYGVLMPKDQQLLAFFTQVAERVFGEKTEPLNMFVVACPRYGEHDEYDRLEEGLSQTASTYLYSLPLLTSILAKNGIPYRGYILVNDTEEQMAGGSLLERLGLTRETYRAKCRGNVNAVNQAISENERMPDVSTHLFTDVFPEFIEVTANLERQLYRLTQSDSSLRLAMAKVADGRLARHAKIMGGKCDFSDSFYLSLHYSAEYMALGYLCRLYPDLSGDSFIVNNNSPNVEQFNSQELLARCTRGDTLSDNPMTIPVFQVKVY